MHIRTGVGCADTDTKFSTIDTFKGTCCSTKFSVHRCRSTSHILKKKSIACVDLLVCMHDVLNLVSDIVVLNVVLEYYL